MGERERAMFTLDRSQLVFLDRLRADIRETTGARIERHEIVGALIDGLAARGLNASKVYGVPDLRRLCGAR